MPTGAHRQKAILKPNIIFTMTMPFAIILNQANESLGESICRPCEVIIQISRRVLMSGEFKEKVISGLRNTVLPMQGELHTS